ncbi:MAG: PAS domain S-box protein [Bacteroidota bacterium]
MNTHKLENRIKELELELSILKSGLVNELNPETSGQNPGMQALKSNEEQFKAIFDKSLTAIIITGDKGNYLSVNKAAAGLFGYSADELLDRNAFDVSSIMLPDDAIYAEYLAKGERTGVFDFLSKDGIEKTARYLAVRVKPNFNMSFLIDITDQRIVEEKLRNSEDQLRKAEYIGKFGHWQLFPDEKRMTSSDGARTIYGFEQNDNSLDSVKKKAMPQYREMLDKALRDLINEGIRYDIEFKIQGGKDGEITDIHSLAEYDAANKVVFGTIQDISDRKRVEDAMQESEQKFHSLYTNMAEGAALHEIIYDAEGSPLDYRIIETNPAFEAQLGLSHESVHGKTSREAYGVANPPFFKACIRVATTGVPTSFETYFETLGKHFIVSVYCPYKGSFATIFNDITERKKAEDNLKRSEEHFRVLFEAAPDAIILADAVTGKILDANKAACRMLGKEYSEIVGMNQADLHPKNIEIDAKDTFFRHVTESQMDGFTQPIENSVVRVDGSTIPVEILAQIITFHDQKVLMGTFRDITERRHAEEAQRKNEAIYRAILDASPDAITISDLDGTYIMVSPSAVAMAGFEREEEMIGRKITDFIIPEERESVFHSVQLMLQGIKTGQNQYKGLRADGSTIDIEANGAVIKDANGIPAQIVFSIRDISERKLAEAEILLKNEKLRKMSSEKDKFFSIVAHDLRSPFNGFLGLTQIMAEDLPSLTMTEIQKIAQSMRTSANNLFRLLENLLYWTQIEQGVIPFSPGVLDLQAVMNESMVVVKELAKNKNIEIQYLIPAGMKIYADGNMFQTMIRNLASNAVKFTPKAGKITISAEYFNNGTEICIEDTGIGMDADMVSKLFHLDGKISRKGTEGEPSTGLGLVICKDFIEKHGGKFWVISEEGKGSKFCILLPLK